MRIQAGYYTAEINGKSFRIVDQNTVRRSLGIDCTPYREWYGYSEDEPQHPLTSGKSKKEVLQRLLEITKKQSAKPLVEVFAQEAQ